MPLIEGIGDEVTQFFIAVFIIAIVSVGWWTTSTSEQRHVQTVWLLDRRRHRAHRRLTNHTHSVTITAEGTIITNTISEASSTASATEVPVAEPVSKPPEAGTSTADPNVPEERNEEERVEEEDERSSIVATMDADACELRQRRIAFYDRTNGSPMESSQASAPDTTIMEHNLAERIEPIEPKSEENTPENNDQPKDASDIRIRLKYINDDLKLVDGKLQEQLGDFKKRHFQGELSTNKLVRLIFNGQVLQQDTKTLQGYGLFDNCVVHCLIHQRRPSPGEETMSDVRSQSGSPRNIPLNNNNQGRDWDLGNFLFALISFTLLSAWYFRYVYAHLYTVTATVGLILMTGVFTIVLFGFYFPDQEHIPPTRLDNNQAQS